MNTNTNTDRENRENHAKTLKQHFELLGYDVTYYDMYDEYSLSIRDSTSKYDRKVSVSILDVYDGKGVFVLVRCKGFSKVEVENPTISDFENIVEKIEEMLL